MLRVNHMLQGTYFRCQFIDGALYRFELRCKKYSNIDCIPIQACKACAYKSELTF